MTSFPGNLHCTMCNLIQYVLKSTIVFDNSCNNLLFSPIDCLYSILGYFLYLVFLLFHLVPILSKYITHHWYFYWFPFQRIAYCITPEHEHHLVAEGNIRQFKVGPFFKKKLFVCDLQSENNKTTTVWHKMASNHEMETARENQHLWTLTKAQKYHRNCQLYPIQQDQCCRNHLMSFFSLVPLALERLDSS